MRSVCFSSGGQTRLPVNVHPGRNRFGLIRFGSGFFEKDNRFGSVRFGSENDVSRFDAVRPSFFGRVVARSGSVCFVSASGPAVSKIERFGLVRFGRFGSVYYSFLHMLQDSFGMPQMWAQKCTPSTSVDVV